MIEKELKALINKEIYNKLLQELEWNRVIRQIN